MENKHEQDNKQQARPPIRRLGLDQTRPTDNKRGSVAPLGYGQPGPKEGSRPTIKRISTSSQAYDAQPANARQKHILDRPDHQRSHKPMGNGPEKSKAMSKEKAKAKKRRSPILFILDLLIIFCLLGAAYFYISPKIKSRRRSKVEASAVAKIDQEISQADDNQPKTVTIKVDPNANKVAGESYEDFGNSKDYKENYVYDANGNVIVNFIGSLKIPKINLNTPIADADNLVALRYGVGHTPESAAVGDDGRCIIFGHWFLDYGKVFNRLEEVKVGDTFKIDILANRTRYFYEIYKVASISDQELYDRLFTDPVDVKSEVVLVTCIVRNNDWRNPTGRFLVYGKLVNQETVAANDKIN